MRLMGTGLACGIGICAATALFGHATAEPLKLTLSQLDQVTAGSDFSGLSFAEADAFAAGDDSFANASVNVVAVGAPDTVVTTGEAEAFAYGDIVAETYTVSEAGTGSDTTSAGVVIGSYGFAVGDATSTTGSTTYSATAPNTSTASGVSYSISSGATYQETETSGTTYGSGDIIRSKTVTSEFENDAFSASITTSTITTQEYPF